MPYASDGYTVVPSFLEFKREGPRRPAHLSLSDIYMGHVVAIYPPGHARNMSKRFVEYTVSIGWKSTSREIVGCIALDSFGSVADYTRVSYRTGPPATEADREIGITLGSNVLVAFIDSNQTAPVIIGAFPHPNAKADTEEGHHLTFEFNGVQFTINDDGELIATVKGATNADGTLREDVDEDAMGASVQFTKDGSIHIHTKDEQEKILIERDKRISLHTKDGKEHITLDREDGKVKIDGDDGTHIGSASDYQLLGESFRKAQNKLNDKLRSELQKSITQLTAAVPLLATPVYGGALAGPNITAVIQSLAQMVAAIIEFEGEGAKKYVSKKNKVG
jgi:hypothetical protein